MARSSPTADPGTTRRSYRSPRREQQAAETRQALVDAATRLFLAHGWAGTAMRDIASEAGVATETIYTHFASKADLLQAAIDVAVVGDNAPVAVADRPEFVALGQGSRAERLAAAARVTSGINQRTAGFARVLREAAPTDKTIAASLTATKARQHTDVASGATLLLGRAPTTAEVDAIWALISVEVYFLLVEDSGWSIEQYEAWLAATLDAVVPKA